MRSSLLANNPVVETITKDQLDRIEKGAWYHSIDLPDGTVVPGLIPVENLRARFDAFDLPADLSGKRALDIGAATGWCSFEMERRGASVVAVDCVEYDDFRVAHRLLNSHVDYRILDVDELTPQLLGIFDIVLFFGVLYHLRHPLLGLERVLTLARDLVLVESFVCDALLPDWKSNGCYMEFYEVDQLGGQIDNWIGPTINCLQALCRSAGFVLVELKYVTDNRAGVMCRRLWEDAPSLPGTQAPAILSAVNNRTGFNVFHPGKDEYICLYFRVRPVLPRLTDLRVEIDGFAVPALTLDPRGEDRWQANLRTPVTLQPGPHFIRLRLVDSPFSEAAVFHYGDPPALESPSVISASATPLLFHVANGLSDSVEFFGYRSDYLCCRFVLEATGLRCADVSIEVDAHRLEPSFVGFIPSDDRGPVWQANVKLPADLSPGAYDVTVRVGDLTPSNPLTIVVKQNTGKQEP